MSTLKSYNGTEWIETNGNIVGDTLPIGSIIPYGGYSIPAGWLACNGQAVSRTTYSELFSKIGTIYGTGDGSTTFNIPDLNSFRTPVGINRNSLDGDGELGTSGGEKTHTLTLNEIPSHRHEGAKWIGNTTISLNGGSQSGLNLTYGSGLSSSSSGIYTEYSGGGQAHNNMPPYLTVNYIIKAEQSAGVVGNVVNTKSNSTNDTYSCNYINGIIENGSNSNGSWTKFADGTMICTLNIIVTDQAINTAYGSLFQGYRVWRYPQAFIERPTVTCSHFFWGTSASWGAVSGVYGESCTLRGYDIQSRAAGTSCQIGATAIGRWK